MADHKRNEGSTIAAYALGGSLLLFATYLFFQFEKFRVELYEKPIDIGSCVIFGAVLCWWAWCKDWSDHEKDSKGKIGFETITMFVTIVTALVAIFTLTDAATHHH